MKLEDVLDKCKGMELLMSEVYLWCSSHYEDMDFRQLFFDMSDQEMSHARMLDDIAKAHPGSAIEIDITVSVMDREQQMLKEMISFVKSMPEMDELFLRIADMESHELNLIFESLCQSDIIGAKLIGYSQVNTKYHINLLKKAVDKLPLSEATKNVIYGIQIRDKDHYKVYQP